MSAFIDLTGASGAVYRFRRVEEQDLPATAGNLVAATGQGAKLRVVFCGAALSLADAAPKARDLLTAERGVRLYIRLNVSRITREAEHADLVAGLAPDTPAQSIG